MTKSTQKKQPGWLNKTEMAASLGISTQAFDKWGIKPIARIGREAFFDVRTVLDNRIEKAKPIHQPDENIDPLAEQKLTQERLRLTREQADAQELKNQVTRGELIPAPFVAFAFSKLVPQIAGTLDTLPMVIRRRHPDLDSRHITTIEKEITKVRNQCADFGELVPELIDEYLDSTE